MVGGCKKEGFHEQEQEQEQEKGFIPLAFSASGFTAFVFASLPAPR